MSWVVAVGREVLEVGERLLGLVWQRRHEKRKSELRVDQHRDTLLYEQRFQAAQGLIRRAHDAEYALTGVAAKGASDDRLAALDEAVRELNGFYRGISYLFSEAMRWCVGDVGSEIAKNRARAIARSLDVPTGDALLQGSIRVCEAIERLEAECRCVLGIEDADSE